MISIVFIKETCYQYWPSTDEPLITGQYTVHKNSETVENEFVCRSFTIESHQDNVNTNRELYG